MELQQGRWSSTIPPWSQRCVKPHILSVRLSHAPALCLLVPELHFPQLRLRTLPRSRTPRASDLPSALSKRPEMIGITIGANKASTGFPLQKHPAEDGSCSLIDVSSPSIYGLTLPHSSCCKCPRDTWKSTFLLQLRAEQKQHPIISGPLLPSDFLRRGTQCWSTWWMPLNHLNSSYSNFTFAEMF